MTQAYPLHWPKGWPRTKTPASSQFRSTLHRALENVDDELRRFGHDTGKPIKGLLISSNYALTDRNPKDAGAAAYFEWDGVPSCIAIDRYKKLEENIQAISKVVEAERAKLRHGGLHIVQAAFRGYASLPAPSDSAGAIGQRPWWEVLGVKEMAGREAIKAAYAKLVKIHHPDVGGDADTFNQIVEAKREAEAAQA